MVRSAEHSNGFGGLMERKGLNGRSLVPEKDCLSQLNWPMLQNLVSYRHLLHECVRLSDMQLLLCIYGVRTLHNMTTNRPMHCCQNSTFFESCHFRQSSPDIQWHTLCSTYIALPGGSHRSANGSDNPTRVGPLWHLALRQIRQ